MMGMNHGAGSTTTAGARPKNANFLYNIPSTPPSFLPHPLPGHSDIILARDTQQPLLKVRSESR
jgi:hypothetical protein